MIETEADFSTDCEDYYFMIEPPDDDEDETFIYITPKSYQNNNKCLLDTTIEIDDKVVDAGLNYLSDSTYGHESAEQARQICLSLGMEEKPDMHL